MASPEAWVWFLAWAAVAEVIGSMAGFGAATVLTPVATFFMDVKTAIAIVAVFHLAGNASRLVFFGRHIHWRTWWRFGLIGLLCSVAGAAVATRLSSPLIELLFGGFLLLYVSAAALTPERMRLPQTPATLIGGGAASGFIAGLLGTGGAIRSACLLAFDLPKEAYLGTSAAIALVVDATRLPVYLAGGFLSSETLPVLGSLLVVAFAGAWVGQRMVRRISAAAFRRFVLVMLALMGARLVLQGWSGVR